MKEMKVGDLITYRSGQNFFEDLDWVTGLVVKIHTPPPQPGPVWADILVNGELVRLDSYMWPAAKLAKS
jgi:hypothetical protein